MKFLSNMKISAKLLLLTAIPTLALVLFALIAVVDKTAITAKMNNVEKMTQISARISALVHETQKERGMTAGFLASGGKSFAGKIDDQRRTVDEKYTILDEYLKAIDTSKLDKHFISKLNQAIKLLEGRNEIRQQVSTLNIKVGDAIAYYTKTNKTFLETVSEMYEEAVTADVAAEVMAYSNFLQAKERAGIERAVLAAVFAQNKFNGRQFQKVVELVKSGN